MTTQAIVAGNDEEGIAGALTSVGVTVTQITGVCDRPALEDAGITDADLYILTDIDQATSIPIAHDLTDEIRTVIYAHGSIPEFVRGQLDLAVDPRLIDETVLAEELIS